MAPTTNRARYPRTRNRRGEAKRTAFLDALETQLRFTPWREITVPELARFIKASPASFYCYWSTLDAAALAMCERIQADGRVLDRHLLLLFRLLEFEARDGLGGGR